MSIEHLSAELQRQALIHYLENSGVAIHPATHKWARASSPFVGFIDTLPDGLVALPARHATNSHDDPPYPWVTLGTVKYGTRHTLPEILQAWKR